MALLAALVAGGLLYLRCTSAFGGAALPDDANQPAAGSESLGGQLLDGLGAGDRKNGRASDGDATNVLSPAEAEQENDAPPAHAASKFDDLGDDLGTPSGPLPLVRARQSMSQAGALLAKPGSVAEARVEQQRALAQLDELIKLLSQQCQGGSSAPNKSRSQASNHPSQPKADASAGPQPGSSTIGPRDSSADLKRPQVTPAELGEHESLVKRLWGQLPERSRAQMQQSFSGEFLPKYELDLEQYYRRLTEEQGGDGK